MAAASCFLNGMAERIPIRGVIGMTASERTRLVGIDLHIAEPACKPELCLIKHKLITRFFYQISHALTCDAKHRCYLGKRHIVIIVIIHCFTAVLAEKLAVKIKQITKFKILFKHGKYPSRLPQSSVKQIALHIILRRRQFVNRKFYFYSDYLRVFTSGIDTAPRGWYNN